MPKKKNTTCIDAALDGEGEVEIFLSSEDIAALKGIACEEGMPYQTLISSLLHKFVTSYGNNN